MRKESRILGVFTAFLLLTTPANAKSAGIKVLELFTSENCPSCPPADVLFNRIVAEGDENILPLACHVTYFDRGARVDPMAKIFCDARQLQYRDSGVSGRLYTPQAVVNGGGALVGSHEEELRAALAETPYARPLGIALNGGSLDMYLPAMILERPADLWLFGYAHRINGYANPVTKIAKLMSWSGQGGSLSFPLAAFQAENYAVIAQDHETGQILAAGKMRNLIKN